MRRPLLTPGTAFMPYQLRKDRNIYHAEVKSGS